MSVIPARCSEHYKLAVPSIASEKIEDTVHNTISKVIWSVEIIIGNSTLPLEGNHLSFIALGCHLGSTPITMYSLIYVFSFFFSTCRCVEGRTVSDQYSALMVSITESGKKYLVHLTC